MEDIGETIVLMVKKKTCAVFPYILLSDCHDHQADPA